MQWHTRILGVFLCIIMLCIYAPSFIFAAVDTSIDISHSSDGYFTVNYSEQNPVKMKVEVTYGKTTTYYDYTAGEESSYAFVKGDGIYTIGLYKNVSGTKYKRVAVASVNVILDDPLSPYLVSTKEVAFSEDDAVSKKAAEICDKLSDQVSKIIAIYEYVHDNISYDYEIAADISSGKIKLYSPKATEILSSHKGICYDFATLFAAMCRSQGIPCRIVKGYYRNVYHAWNEVYLDGLWYKVDSTISINKEILKKKSN